MEGTDRHDGQIHIYKISREYLKKYYQKTFRYMLDMPCLNKFFVYINSGGKLESMDFVITLGESLAVIYK